MLICSIDKNNPGQRENDEFFLDAVKGLSQPQKMLPSKYFYDAEGSRLFEKITKSDEYYLTNCEREILERHTSEMIGADSHHLVEFGSGSSVKTTLLLRALADPATYIPIDVSPSALQEASATLRLDFPNLEIRPIIADFTETSPEVVTLLSGTQPIGFFSGSTIGNFPPKKARALLQTFGRLLGDRARLLVGFDLLKDIDVIERAYNDDQGITAAFNLNILSHFNRVSGEAFDVSSFRHLAYFNTAEGCIEMHLQSVKDQIVRLSDKTFKFTAGETILTEQSYKYTVGAFNSLGLLSGWLPGRTWLDKHRHYCVYEFQDFADRTDNRVKNGASEQDILQSI